MKRISALIFAFLLFAFTAFGQTETRASKTWEVSRYTLNVTLPQNEGDRMVVVKAVLDLKNLANAASSRLTLRISPNAEVQSTAVGADPAEFTKSEEQLGVAALQKISLRVPPVAAGGNVSVTVNYKLKVDDNTALSTVSSFGSQFLPLSYWYPTPNNWYFPRGADFGKVKIAVNKGAGQQLIAAGSAVADSFETAVISQPFFVTGNFKTLSANGVEVFYPSGKIIDRAQRANEIATLASEAQKFIENLSGRKISVPVKIAAVRRGAGFAEGGVILIDESVFRREKLDDQTVTGIVEGLSRIWLGNELAVTDDGFGVIREGLSRFVATKFVENKFGKEVADVMRLRHRSAYATIAKREAPLQTVSPLDDTYYSEVANKGSIVWRFLEKLRTESVFWKSVRDAGSDGNISLKEVQANLELDSVLIDGLFMKSNTTDLQIGLPQLVGNDCKVALRNAGTYEVNLTLAGFNEKGDRFTTSAIVPAGGFSEAVFKSSGKLTLVEVDPDKMYPQTEYSNDIAPRSALNIDPMIGAKQAFDKGEYPEVERIALPALKQNPQLDEMRTLLARSYVARNMNDRAEAEYKSILSGVLPNARALAWANVGLATIMSANGKSIDAGSLAQKAIFANGESGASLQARKLLAAFADDASIKRLIDAFDKAAAANDRNALLATSDGGESKRFFNGIAGQTVSWQSTVRRIDQLDDTVWLVGVDLRVRMLNREDEAGSAIYRIEQTSRGLKITGVEYFDVR